MSQKKKRNKISIQKSDFTEFQFYYGEYAKYSVLGKSIQEGKANFYLVLDSGLYMKDFWTYSISDTSIELGIPNGPMKQTVLDQRYFPSILSYFKKMGIKEIIVMLVERIHDVDTADATKKRQFLERHGFIAKKELNNDEVSMVQLQYSFEKKKDD